MPLYVKLYRDTPNPLGFPEDYPADAIDSDTNPGAPYRQMTRDEYTALVEKSRAVVRALIDQEKAAKKTVEAQKTDTISASFDQLKSIKDKIDGANGKIDAADQVALMTHMLDAMLGLREPLLQMQTRFVGGGI